MRKTRLPSASGSRSWLDESPIGAAPAGHERRTHSPDLDPKRILDVLHRRRTVILIGLLSVLASVALFTYLTPRSYESSATILVDTPERRTEVPALAVLQRAGRGTTIETEIELLRSRRVLAAAADRLDLHVTVETTAGLQRPLDVFADFEAAGEVEAADYRLTPEPGGAYVVRDAGNDSVVGHLKPGQWNEISGWRAVPSEDVSAGTIRLRTRTLAATTASLQQRIDVAPVHRNADLIRLTCRARTGAAARRLCQAVSESYVELRNQLQRVEATAAARFLRDQVQRLRARLEAAEDTFEAYGRRHNVVALAEQATQEVRQFAELKARRDELETERGALAELISEVEQSDRDHSKYRDLISFPTFLKNQTVAELVESLVELDNRRSDLALRRTEKNAELAALDERVADIERQLTAIAASYEQALAAEVRWLDRTLETVRGRLTVMPSRQVQLARLDRQRTLLEDLYRLLETRLREAEIAQTIELANVSILDPASEPFRPSSPDVRLNAAVALILGLSFGIGLALYREMNDTRLRGRRDVEQETGLPVISMVPRLRRPRPLRPGSLASDLPAPVATTAADRAVEDPARPEAATSGAEARPGVSGRTPSRGSIEQRVMLEAFRALAADLRFATRHFQYGGLRSVAVTSASRGDGKTFVACNLALVRASLGARTLLIDGDMRARGVGRFLDLPSEWPGLSDVLTGSGSLPSNGFRLVQSRMLRVIPAGTPTPHSAALLESDAFDRLLHRAETEFDLTVIDTPPLNLLIDAATIAAAVDAVVVVVRSGVTDRGALELTLDRLRRAGGRVIGVVLNGVAPQEPYMSYRWEA